MVQWAFSVARQTLRPPTCSRHIRSFPPVNIIVINSSKIVFYLVMVWCAKVKDGSLIKALAWMGASIWRSLWITIWSGESIFLSKSWLYEKPSWFCFLAWLCSTMPKVVADPAWPISVGPFEFDTFAHGFSMISLVVPKCIEVEKWLTENAPTHW